MSEEKEFMKNFGMMIPAGPFVEYKPKPVSIWIKVLCALVGHRWGFAGISYMGPSFPRTCKRCKKTKWFDKPTLRMRFEKWITAMLNKFWPLCGIGLHIYKSHYGYSSYTYGGDHPLVPRKEVRQEIYKCSCCKKIKTVNINTNE
jgi:hypothetical protein